MPAQGRLGDKSQVPADAHACGACPHPAIGPAITGSATVYVNGRPALRVSDTGIHAACCGPNTWVAVQGSPTVLIENLQAHRLGDQDAHCGGVGFLVEGSPDVLVGESASGAGGSTGASMRAAKREGAPFVATDCDGPRPAPPRRVIEN